MGWGKGVGEVVEIGCEESAEAEAADYADARRRGKERREVSLGVLCGVG